MNPNHEPARSPSGLILPAGFKCEQCAAKNGAIVHLKKQLEQLAGEVDRMHREVGSVLANRAERREVLNRQRALSRGRKPNGHLKLAGGGPPE